MKIIEKIVRDFLIALFTVLIFFYAFDAHAGRAIDVMCNVIDYIGGIGGLVITLIIIGASLLAIFGRMPWPALLSLGMFSAVFFGASAIVKKVTEKEVYCPKGQILHQGKCFVVVSGYNCLLSYPWWQCAAGYLQSKKHRVQIIR
ncbi:TrbC/VirB2 family protein [Wolbachia pipientis]|uniref:TrbC/VirB2 family protein n=1 Tax=Wolbachia pipientis TaxID=955 RepID=UPI00202F78BD|nr:TrbC/VirB2 family protein [Wolbachia pipientis]MCM1002577.1 TrbC/VirB2 family protein [Wolbachia pipientis]